jgi:hypothetical protein
MARIMNDPKADVARRDRMAIALAGIEARTGAAALGKKARAALEARSAGHDSDWGTDLDWNYVPPSRD